MNSNIQNIPKLAAFSSNWQSACPRLRVLAPAESAGMTVTRCGLQTNTDIINDSDIIIILRDYPRFREAYNKIIVAARAVDKPIVYHLDDLLYQMPETHPDYLKFRTIRPAILLGIIQSDLVIVSTEELRAEVRHFNENVVNVANYLDDHTWNVLSKTPVNRESALVIAYMGTSGHAADLQMIADPLTKILNKFKGKIRFRSYGTNPGAKLLSRSDVDWIEWNIESYEEFIDKFAREKVDIFVAPLIDNQFNRCKSAIKFLEYSAKGAPGVYSALTPYTQVIEDGQNGFLAASIQDWEIKLTQLIENSELRAKLGKMAQQTVKQNWLLNTSKDEWVKAYNLAFQCTERNMHLEKTVRLADQWSDEIQKSLIEAEQLHSAINSSRMGKILKKWWQLRGFLNDVAR